MNDNTKFVRALLSQDWTSYNALVEQFERDGKGTPVAVIGFAFTSAAKRRFKSSKDVSEVILFVADARRMLLEGRELPPREAEALLCAALDIEEPWVEETLDKLDTGAIAEIEGQLLFKLIDDEKLTPAQLDEFLAEVERTEAEWDKAN